LFHGSDELRELGGAVMRRDIAVRVAKKDLARLPVHAGRAEPAAERVLEIVHPDVLKTPRRWPAELLRVALGRPNFSA
jgi:hypothetical protein